MLQFGHIVCRSAYARLAKPLARLTGGLRIRHF
jgi:hypothetical protein